MILQARKVTTILVVSLLTTTFAMYAQSIVPHVLKHKNVSLLHSESKNELLFSLNKALAIAEDEQESSQIRHVLSDISQDFGLLKPLAEESLNCRNKNKKESLLLPILSTDPQRSLAIEASTSSFNSMMNDPAKKDQFLNEIRSLVKDIRVSMDLDALANFERWKRNKIVGPQIRIEKSLMKWLDSQMIPQGYDQLLRLVHKAASVQNILLRYMVMIERKSKIGESDVLGAISPELTKKFFERCENIFLSELREALEVMFVIKHTLSPVIKYSLELHGISYEDSFFNLLFSHGDKGHMHLFRDHVKTLNDFDRVCMEFLAFGQDLIGSFSSKVVQQHQAWKKTQS